MEKYFIYCRRSSESEDRQVLSIESQIEAMQALAQRLGLQIAEIFTESRTAKEPGRPVFNAMMKRVYASEAKGILTWKLDRLARNPIDGAAVIWALKQSGIKILTEHQTYSHAEDNTILMYMEFGMAQKYVDDLSRNVKRGNKTKLGKGEWLGIAPMGYLNYTDPTSREKTLIIDRKRFPIVRKMWDLMLANGHTVDQITDIANNKWGLRTRQTARQGGKPVSRSFVYRMFKSSFYCGIMQRKEGIYTHRYKKMVTPEEYDRVQEILGRKDRPRPQKHAFAYTGILKCRECGCSVTAEELTKILKSSGQLQNYTYYRCTKKKRGVKCSEPYVSLAYLEDQLVDVWDQIHVPTVLVPWVDATIERVNQTSKCTAKSVSKNLQSTYARVAKNLQVLTDMRIRELINDSEFSVQKERLQTEKLNLEKQIRNLEKQDQKTDLSIKNVFRFSHRAKMHFKYGDLVTKKQMLQFIGSNWTLSGKKLYGALHKPFRLIDQSLIASWPEIAWLQPNPYAMVELDSRDFRSLSSRLLRLVRDVRKAVLESDHDYTLNLPSFVSSPIESIPDDSIPLKKPD